MSSQSQSFKITAEMFEKLEYDETKVRLENKNNNLKSKISMREWKINLKKITLQDIFEKINKNLDVLANIESEEMCISVYLAKMFIKKSISPLTINRDNYKLPVKNILAVWETNLTEILEQLFLFINFEVESFTFYVDSAREKFFSKLLFDILGMVKESSLEVNKKEIMYLESLEINYKAVVVFKASDINAAIDQIVNSFEDPFSKTGVRSIYVQESCYDNFCYILCEKLRYYSENVLQDLHFCNKFNEYQEILDKMKAKKIQPKLPSNEKIIVPTICLNFARRFYDDGRNIAPIVNMQSFRTVKELISLMTEDQSGSVSIWADNNSIAYEIVLNSNITFFELNCHDICQYPLYKVKNYIFLNTFDIETTKIDIPKSGVVVDGNYHYQFFEVKSGSIKVIICPIGVTFAN